MWQGPPFVRDLIEVVPDTGDIRVLSRIDRETVDWLNLTGTALAVFLYHQTAPYFHNGEVRTTTVQNVLLAFFCDKSLNFATI